LALAVSSGWVMPAHASAASDAAIQQELAAMRAQMQQMASRIDALEGQLVDARARAEAAETKANAASAALAAIPPATAPGMTAKPATDVTWDGAPKLATRDGWSFKPRGRMQQDLGTLNPPAALVSKDTGINTRLRRAYIGFDGTMPGNFGYRAEIDVAPSTVTVTDLYLTYKPNPKLTLTLGQQKPAWGMEELTSDLFTPFMERSAYISAFGFERRVGLSAAWVEKNFLVQGGLYADDLASMTGTSNNSYSADGRVVFMPKLGEAQLHLGGSIHYRKLNDLTSSVTYSVRPFLRTSDLRLVNTGAITGATAERGIGAEFAYARGRLHVSSESFWQKVVRPGLVSPTFNGGYAEVGYMLTDDVTPYKNGQWERTRPKHPVGKGGMGAVQMNLRYDWLDLNSGAIVGGRQQIAGVSLIWMPTDYVRFLANYGHIWIDDAAVPAGTLRTYNADAFGLRAQFDF
jgi:phosphate-selective porin OprO/OprP